MALCSGDVVDVAFLLSVSEVTVELVFSGRPICSNVLAVPFPVFDDALSSVIRSGLPLAGTIGYDLHGFPWVARLHFPSLGFEVPGGDPVPIVHDLPEAGKTGSLPCMPTDVRRRSTVTQGGAAFSLVEHAVL